MNVVICILMTIDTKKNHKNVFGLENDQKVFGKYWFQKAGLIYVESKITFQTALQEMSIIIMSLIEITAILFSANENTDVALFDPSWWVRGLVPIDRV